MPFSTSKPRILCVDDKAENLKIRTMMLEQFGCETISACDYDESMRILGKNEVDLLLIDYHLADGRTGEEIARDVRGAHPELPMIMLTGDSKLPQSAQDSVDAVLIKGLSDPRLLLDTIQELLPSKEVKQRRPMLIEATRKSKAS